jgi:hypothetical protein
MHVFAPLDEALYHCSMCGVPVEVGAGSVRPLTMLVGASGEPNVRVISLAGAEVHRCPFPI